MAPNTDSVSLTAKLTQVRDRLLVRYSIRNDGRNPILVFNRLWTGESGREPDTQRLYRFVTKRGLRLLLGSAPLPSDPVTLRNLPEVTKVEAFTQFEEEVTTPIPVTEYNWYFSDASADLRVAEQVNQVELFVQYVDANGVELKPSTIHPGAFWATNAAAMSNNSTLRSGSSAMSLAVLRQTDEFSRLVFGQE